MENENLLSLATRFFKSRGYLVEYNVKYEGFSGILHTFDILIRKGKSECAIFVLDWKRTVGINMIMKAEKASKDVGLDHPIIISKMFSYHAKAYSNKRRIRLITKRELLS